MKPPPDREALREVLAHALHGMGRRTARELELNSDQLADAILALWPRPAPEPDPESEEPEP
jgi:hypothetical protein